MTTDLPVGSEPDRIEAWLVRPDDERGAITLVSGVVTIADGVITSIEPGERSGRTPRVLLPGFVDAHTHLPQFDAVGHEGMTLLDWLADVIFPAEAKWSLPGYAAQSSSRAIQRMLSCGTTGFAAYATSDAAATRAAIDRARAAGVRAWSGLVRMDRNGPGELLRDPVKQIEQAAELCALAPAGSRVAHAVSPRFAISCGADLLAAAGKLAQETSSLVQTHLSEMQDECRLTEELFDGTPYAEVYDRAGLLHSRSVLGHGVWLSEGERRVLAERKAWVAHCPTANTFLKSGTMDLAGANTCGMQTALGSDVAGGPDPSMPRVARAMIEAAIHRGDTPPSASEAWWMITRGNAQALGWDDAGVIREGAPADLVCLRPDPQWLAGGDPLARLLWGWDERQIEATFLRGRVAYAANG